MRRSLPALRVVDANDRALGRQRRRGFDELPRRRNREVSEQRPAIGPGLDEHEAQGILDVAVDGVRDASGLGTRAEHVRQAEREELVDRLGPGEDAPRDDDQAKFSGFCGSPSVISYHGALEATYPWIAGRMPGSPSSVPQRTETMSFVASP